MGKYDYLKKLTPSTSTSAPSASKSTGKYDYLKKLTPSTSTSNATDKYGYLKDLASGSGSYTNLAYEKERGIFEGNFLEKIIDFFQIPEYGLSGYRYPESGGIWEAIKGAKLPSEITGTTGAEGLAMDIAGDPLTYLTGGLTTLGKAALKKTALGTAKKFAPKVGKKIGQELVEKTVKEAAPLATTLGKQAELGQRALVNLGIPFTGLSVPIIKGEKILKGLTKAGDVFKGTKLGTGLEKAFGLVPATGKIGTEAIEQQATINKSIQEAKKLMKRKQKVVDGMAVEVLEQYIRRGDKLSKEDFDAFGRNVRQYAAAIGTEVKPAYEVMSSVATKLFDDLKPVAKEIKLAAEEIIPLTSRLAGKGFTNVPIEKSTKGPRIAGKELGGLQSLEKLSGGSKIGGKIAITGKTEGRIVTTGQKVVRIKDDWYDSTAAAKIKNLINKQGVLESELKTNPSAAAKARLQYIEDELGALMSTGMKRTGASSSEVNTALRKVGQDPMYSEDIFQEMFATASGAGKAAVRKEAAEVLKNTPGLLVKIPEGGIPKGLVKVDLPDLKGYATTPVIAKALNETYTSYSSLGAVEDTFRAWNTAQNHLKGVLTYVNIAFHARNVVSNLWMSVIGGLKSPISFTKGYTISAKANKLKKKGLSGEKLYKALGTDGKYYKEAVEAGLGGTGAFYGDLEKTFSKKNFVYEYTGKAGAYLEDSAKLGLYIDKRKQGFSPFSAAQEVRKYLFDYTDLTDVERILFKSVMPFYTWSRKNIPLQVGMLITKPGTVTVLDKAKKAVESMVEGEPLDPSLLPEWMQEGFNLYLGENEDGLKNYLSLNGFLPTVSLGELDDPLGVVFRGITPLLKTPLELVNNYDFFFKKQIREYEGQRKPVFGMDIPLLSTPEGRKILDLVRPIKDVEALLGLDEFANDRTKVSRLIKYIGGLNIKNYSEENQIKSFNYGIRDKIFQLKKAIKKESDNEAMVAELQILLDKLEDSIIET